MIIGPGMTDNPRHRIRWVIALPRPDPPITDRTCMPPGPSSQRRLARQLRPRASLRDCCWHHSVDWRTASAIAIRLARQLRRENINDDEEKSGRLLDLIREAGAPEPEKEAVTMLLYPGCGIQLDHIFGPWRLYHVDGRKRTYAMLESGVRRTVISR